MPTLILQHCALGTAGRLASCLRDHGRELDVRRVDLPADGGGDPVPGSLEDIEAIITLGGPANVADGHPWIDQELGLLREAHERALPVFGICLGAQLIAKALGGEVGPCATPEFGFCEVDATPPGHTDRVLAGIPWRTSMFQTHSQEISALPPGAIALQASATTGVQAFCTGLRTYGVQYHPECDLQMIDGFFRACTDEFAAAGIDETALKAQCDAAYASYVRLTDRLFLNLVSCVLPVTRPIVA